MKVQFEPIGVIRTPFRRLEDMPIQPSGADGVAGRVELEDSLAEGLDDLDGFSHVLLLYHLHRSKGYELKVVPFLDHVERGLFATRAPRRPCPIGISVVRLVRVAGPVLHVENVDMLSGTPLLDIKPYVPDFDRPGEIRTGWLEKARRRAKEARSDGRFAPGGDDPPPAR